ncbi:MAG: helix-turn-helix domain-containing protein [Candidatus Dormibacteraeota bacterium]|nr:helix-turn-helix domain-containing protein [Candidatus Dormibacteraeota bacterium]
MTEETLSAGEAAYLLGVKVPTLYAYVARGVIRRRRKDGRRSRFLRPEIERLAQSRRRTDSELVIHSSITSIEPEGHRYRGHSAQQLAMTASFEAVAELLWGNALGEQPQWSTPQARSDLGALAGGLLPAELLPIERLPLIVTAISAGDPHRFDLSRHRVVAAARALILGVVRALPGPGKGRPAKAASAVANDLWLKLAARNPRPAELRMLNAALVLAADHELSASTLAARIAASVGAGPYAVVTAGLGPLQGVRHGAAALAAERLLAEMTSARQAQAVLGERMRMGQRPAGFGMPLYPQGDPRARLILGLVGDVAGRSGRFASVEAVLEAANDLGLPPPSIDFALAALTHSSSMNPGAAELIFAIGRMAGWLAHALEEYASPTPFRLRAQHFGDGDLPSGLPANRMGRAMRTRLDNAPG